MCLNAKQTEGGNTCFSAYSLRHPAPPTATDDPALSAAQQVVAQVTTFLRARGGRAPSAALVGHFRSAVPSEQVPLFKQALKQVAAKHTVGSQVFWQLKPDDMFAGAQH